MVVEREGLRTARRGAASTGKLRLGGAILAEQLDVRTPWTFRAEILRLREIEAVIRARHGRHVPATDDALIYAEAVALALTDQPLTDWCCRWVPSATATEIEAASKGAEGRKRMQSPDECARLLNVSLAERTDLGLKTIGACDVSAAQRKAVAKARKREHDRTKAEQRRRAAGAKAREAYEADSLAQRKPWEMVGMTRRTWYRNGKPTNGTSPSIIDKEPIGDGPVPPVPSLPVKTVPKVAAIPERPSSGTGLDVAPLGADGGCGGTTSPRISSLTKAG